MPFRQDLSAAKGGTITGRGGRTQQLGKAAMRRMPATPAAPKPAWQQLAEKGVGGQGSAAANKAALAAQGGAGGGAPAPGITPQPSDMARAAQPMPGAGGPSDMIAQRIPEGSGMRAGLMSKGGATDLGIARRIPGRGGMASYLRPPVEMGGRLTDFMDRGAAPPAELIAGMPGGAEGGAPLPGMAPGDEVAGRVGQALEGGVDSNAFAANGGTPSGAPLQPPGAGQGARIQALIARLRGGGMQPRMQAA